LAENIVLNENDKKVLLDSIRSINDFPKAGIVFKDVTTLLNNKEAFKLLMNHLEQRYKSYNLDYVAGIDSRGFIFGAALADRLGVGFVPVRKKKENFQVRLYVKNTSLSMDLMKLKFILMLSIMRKMQEFY